MLKVGSLVRCIAAEPCTQTNLEDGRLYIVTDFDKGSFQVCVINLLGERMHWRDSEKSIIYDACRFKAINVPDMDAQLIKEIMQS